MKKEYTPELQAEFTNEVLTQFAEGLDQVLRDRLNAISPKVPQSTIQNLRYQIMEANASNISAQYKLYFQDSGRQSEMKRLQKASEYVQAHWKGFMQRNDKQMKKGLAKLRKKKRKLRKKGKL